MEKHHKVQILDEALEAAVKLSHRYIPARQLPDKAVSLLDTACARVAVSQHATPAEVDDCRSRIEALETELGIIAREEAIGIDIGRARGASVKSCWRSRRTPGRARCSAGTEEKVLVDGCWSCARKLRDGAAAGRRHRQRARGQRRAGGAAKPTAAAHRRRARRRA